MKAQLFRGDLHYADVTLHTAASGPVTAHMYLHPSFDKYFCTRRSSSSHQLSTA